MSAPGASRRSRFALAGRSPVLDLRVDAARADLADVRLADRVFAPHYAAPMPCTAGRRVPVMAASGDPAEQALSEVLAGEPFEVLEVTSSHHWGISPIDGAVGYVPRDAFVPAFPTSHLVAVARAPLRAGVTGDAATLDLLAMGTRLAAVRAASAAMEVDGGFVAEGALLPLADAGGEPADFAERLLGVAYRAGGRSGAGVDAAGLVFLCHMMAGREVPRFADLQAGIGHAIGGGEVRRGDLLCVDDGVAIASDPAFAIRVRQGGIVERVEIAALGSTITARRFA